MIIVICAVIALVSVGGLVGISRHVTLEQQRGHRIALVYGPILLALIMAFASGVIYMFLYMEWY